MYIHMYNTSASAPEMSSLQLSGASALTAAYVNVNN